VARDTAAVDELPDFAALREAVAKVKAFLDDLGVGIPPNDLIITGITDYDDLWMFSWNNGWVLWDQPEFGYPGCFAASGLQGGRSVATDPQVVRLGRRRLRGVARRGGCRPRSGQVPAAGWPRTIAPNPIPTASPTAVTAVSPSFLTTSRSGSWRATRSRHASPWPSLR
jgi:hypothetical protein